MRPPLEAEPLFYPFAFWLPLAGVVIALQFACLALVLRPARGRWLRALAALLLADALVVVVLRACVAQMGRLDYSGQFATWRWWFLAAGLTLLGLPLPLWMLALRTAGVGGTVGEGRPLLHPRFAAVLAMWLLCGLATLLLGADVTFWPRPARVTRVEVSLPGLPRALEGTTLAVLADLHTGELVTPAVLRTRLRSLPRLRPDLLVVLGDATFLDSTYQREATRVLQPYVIPQHSFAVAGNFDSAAGTDTLREELGRVGIRLLQNESARVSVRGQDLVIAGLGDLWTDDGDLARTLAKAPRGLPIVLISHSPDVVAEASARRLPLVLSGHLHGGQIVFPFAGPAVGMSRFGTRFASGTWRVGATTLVVSRGLGEESLPLRLFCPPEILLVTLRSGK